MNELKITFLGTSHGLPEKGRYCSSILLEAGEKLYFIDAGAPLADIIKAKDLSYEKIAAAFITHAHLDHTAGLPMFISIPKWFCPDAAFVCYLPDQTTKNAVDPIINDRPEESNMNIKAAVYTEGVIYDDGTLAVTAIPNDHLKKICRPSYSFCIECMGKTLLFTGDLTGDMHDFPQIAFEKKFELVVTECAHAPAETLEGIIRRIDAKKVAVTHTYPFEKLEHFAAMNGTASSEIIIAEDNMTLMV